MSSIILLATYNGAEHLADQLESIIGQTYDDWVCLISDDGSRDDTLLILQEFKRRDSRFILINNIGEHGAYANFFNAIEYAKKRYGNSFDYYFYSDQDDVWQKNKMEQQIKSLRDVDESLPALCYSDLAIMDQNSNDLGIRIGDSAALDIEKSPLSVWFTTRHVWGTAMAHNRALWDKIIVPSFQRNHFAHDTYLSRIAASYGKLIYINEPLVRYRRHEDNVSDLPVQYGFLDAVRRCFLQMDEVVARHASVYDLSLEMIDLLECPNQAVEEVRHCILAGGFDAVCFLMKNRITVAHNFFNQAALYLLLLTGVYKSKMTKFC